MGPSDKRHQETAGPDADSVGLTSYPDVDALLLNLRQQLQQILGIELVGLYLYGSLVTGDFCIDISDLDLLVVIASDLDAPHFSQLQQMHATLERTYSEWEGRIEAAYLSKRALKTYKTEMSQIAIISPGEPFHLKKAGRDWLLNWRIVREKGLTLYGPSPKTLIEPVSKQEFVETVREHAIWWSESIDEMRERPSQAYAILTLCRALYAWTKGDQVSKKRAAEWAQGRYPQWAELIQQALIWRREWRDKQVDHAATFPHTVRFVQFAIHQIVPQE